MSSEVPPWLQEQLARYDQLQQSLQAILTQKQQVEAELAEIEKALEELRKAPSDTTVYKFAGTIMLKADRESLLKELEEKRELANTRIMVLKKQEDRIRSNLQELQNKINEAIKSRQGAS